MYLFIVSERGDRTNICSDFRIFDIDGFIEYINLQDRIKSYYKQYRIAKLNDDSFKTRIFKYLTLEEFEDIFKNHIEDIKELLVYTKSKWGIDYPFFRKDIYTKYGTLKEEN